MKTMKRTNKSPLSYLPQVIFFVSHCGRTIYNQDQNRNKMLKLSQHIWPILTGLDHFGTPLII